MTPIDILPAKGRTMLASPSSMLENPAVLRALDQTFHSTTIDHAEPLAAGLSTDLIYRITVKGSPCILRIMTRIDERMDPARIFACMRAASGAGIAPPLRYSSPEDGITIIDFIDPVPFPASRALAHLPAILRKLHALPPFPEIVAHTDVGLSLLMYWIVIGPPVMFLAAVIREREVAEASLHDQRSQLAQVMRIATAGELSMEMAHELRQPMQAILANAWAGLRLLEREPADLTQLREILEDIVQQDQQASRVVGSPTGRGQGTRVETRAARPGVRRR